MMRRTLAILTICGLLCAAAAQAQWIANPPGGRDLQLRQLFKVHTQGTMADGAGTINERGTAFAITPTTLMTAKHVPHEARKFLNKASNSKIHIPSRFIELTYAAEVSSAPLERKWQLVTVTPSAFPTIDASRLDLTELPVTPLPLSACGVEKGGTYFLMKFRKGKIGVPVIVPLIADVEVHTGSGALRRFTHSLNTGNADIPEGGDSGSPILDAEGHVVGLLSAILEGTPEVYVTLTSSWVDLVPKDVSVKCDKSVTRDDIDALRQEMQTYVDTRLAPLDTAVTTLQAKVAALEDTTGELKNAVDALGDRLNRVRNNTEATVQAMVAEAKDKIADATGANAIRELEGDVIRAAIAELRKAKIVPTLSRFAQELSEETWSFRVGGYNADLGAQFLNAAYSREISAPPFADNLSFCFRLMLPPQSNGDGSALLSKDDIRSLEFYRSTEVDSSTRTCHSKPHGPVGRGGIYTYAIPVTDERMTETEGWKGLIYGYVYQKKKRTNENGEEVNAQEIVHRMVLAANPDNLSDPMECYYFGLGRVLGVADDLATFARNYPDGREDFVTCPS